VLSVASLAVAGLVAYALVRRAPRSALTDGACPVCPDE
jgi:hypothetical protein